MKSNFSTKISNDYKLGMPKMFFGGISENWFLKEFGDLHWELISKSYNTDADKLVDSSGNRLYASFVRIKWESNRDLSAFKENDAFNIDAEISRFGNKMFFSEQELSGTRKKINASLMTVFSSRSTNNTSLKKAIPISEIDERTATHETLPDSAKGFLNVKSKLLGEEKGSWNHELKGYSFKETEDAISEYTYEIDPYTDINGVGLLYFASYPTINDKCEREVFNQLFEIEENDWANLGSCAARDIFYFGNANPKDKLIYKLNNYEIVGGNKIIISSSIYRAADNVLISKQFTVRNLIKGWKKHKSEGVDVNKIKEKKVSPVLEEKNPITSISKENLLEEICGFLAKMIGEKSVARKTDLSLLGVESVLFMELSEHLNIKLGLDANPSKFYGLKNCEEIAESILETAKVEVSQSEESLDKEEIAIVSTSFKIPGASELTGFWNTLKEGESAIGILPKSRWKWPANISPLNSHKGINQGGFIENIDQFDPTFFNISPLEAELMDPQQRILLELSWELMENAAHNPQRYVGKNTGVFIGASGSDYDQLSFASKEGLSVTGSAQALLANRISYFYDLKGPSKTIDTACSSSLVALNDAVEALQNGKCTEAIVGGIHLMCNGAKTITYYNSKMLSTDGKCQTFDENANGYVRAEGAVLCLLKPKKKAIEDGDKILGIIKSSVVNHGGRVSGVTVPNPKQQANLVMDALTKAKLNLADLSYIEAHGTGTSLGDPIEINGLNEVARRMSDKFMPNTCGLGSVKTNLGHLEAASGLVGVLKVLAAMSHEELPATINFQKLNPKIDLANGPFYIQNEHTKWPLQKGKAQRFAGISNFGVGGTNAHVILASPQKETDTVERNDGNQFQVFTLSAKSQEALFSSAKRLTNYIQRKANLSLERLAKTLQLGRAELKFRLAIVVNDKQALLNALNEFSDHKESVNHVGKQDDSIDLTMDDSLLSAIAKGEQLEKNLNKIATQWVTGVCVDWKKINDSSNSKYVDLPTYPFAKEKYWLNEKIENQPAESKRISIHPEMDDAEFVVELNDPELLKINSDHWKLAFPELMKEVANVSKSKESFALKNVFWPPSRDLVKMPDKLRTKLIRTEEEVYFEMSVKDEPIFLGELIQISQFDSISLDKFEQTNSISESTLNDINTINSILQEKGKGRITQLRKISNSYYGEYILRTEEECTNQVYAEALFSLWIVYKLIKDRSGGIPTSLKESLTPYFSSEVKFIGELDSKLRFKIVDHGISCDLHFYDQTGKEQLSIKKLKEDRQSTGCVISK